LPDPKKTTLDCPRTGLIQIQREKQASFGWARFDKTPTPPAISNQKPPKLDAGPIDGGAFEIDVLLRHRPPHYPPLPRPGEPVFCLFFRSLTLQQPSGARTLGTFFCLAPWSLILACPPRFLVPYKKSARRFRDGLVICGRGELICNSARRRQGVKGIPRSDRDWLQDDSALWLKKRKTDLTERQWGISELTTPGQISVKVRFINVDCFWRPRCVLSAVRPSGGRCPVVRSLQARPRPPAEDAEKTIGPCKKSLRRCGHDQPLSCRPPCSPWLGAFQYLQATHRCRYRPEKLSAPAPFWLPWRRMGGPPGLRSSGSEP